MAIDKAALLAQRVDQTEEVQVAGGTVVVRPLTRAEAMALQGKEMKAELMERRLISMAMVEPEMTVDEVRQWQDVSPAGELQNVVEAITRLSGMEQHVVRDEMARFRD